ncbi:hypothetical protein CHLRE_09g402402v5 [Chlamydomonas reinhardtii]|uniref:Pherophorin domain-containing protein n=1 Tax=Chlamydomonas reinhardtii TaxID=3055 RepID=A0A2K3DCQ4_CHLRE|nr:uncharacterized protein CHLRE_09g402402v5 [Chlamydomonas reinhardtii]PNW78312.1 hypothetical protein CHLRE_09g402402v5 [Chlamydomonas reinhardtii]
MGRHQPTRRRSAAASSLLLALAGVAVLSLCPASEAARLRGMSSVLGGGGARGYSRDVATAVLSGPGDVAAAHDKAGPASGGAEQHAGSRRRLRGLSSGLTGILDLNVTLPSIWNLTLTLRPASPPPPCVQWHKEFPEPCPSPPPPSPAPSPPPGPPKPPKPSPPPPSPPPNPRPPSPRPPSPRPPSPRPPSPRPPLPPSPRPPSPRPPLPPSPRPPSPRPPHPPSPPLPCEIWHKEFLLPCPSPPPLPRPPTLRINPGLLFP